MTCSEFADFLDGYLSGGLPSNVRSTFEHHLVLCANCVSYLQHYRESIALGRRSFQPTGADLPADVPEDLIQAILALR